MVILNQHVALAGPYSFEKMKVSECTKVLSKITTLNKNQILITSASRDTLIIKDFLVIDKSTEIKNMVLLMDSNATIYVSEKCKLTLSNHSILKNYSNKYQWSGVVVADHANFEVNNSIIEEAQIAIQTSQGHIKTDDVIFNANNISIQVDNWNGPASNLDIKCTTFQCNNIANQNPMTMIAPFAGQNPEAGIVLNNCVYEKIGNEDISNTTIQLQQNIFKYLNCGIRSTQSNVEIVNNRFDYIDRYQTVCTNGISARIPIRNVNAETLTNEQKKRLRLN